MKAPTTIRTVSALAAASLGLLATSEATLLAYEPFDYAPGSDIVGQNGGIGFSGAWRENSAGSVPAGSFTAIASTLPGGGTSALATGEFGTLQPARDFATAITGSDGGSLWISYYGQRQGAAQDPATTSPPNMYPRGVNVSFFDSTADERTGIGNSSNATANEWSIIPEGSGDQRVGSGTPFTQAAWAVMRIDYVGDATVGDNFYLWIDPDPNVEPTIGTADVTILDAPDASDLAYTRPFIGNESDSRPFGVLEFDDFRIGTTYADMSAVPEPSVSLLGGLGLLGLLRRRRKA